MDIQIVELGLLAIFNDKNGLANAWLLKGVTRFFSSFWCQVKILEKDNLFSSFKNYRL